jgi:hypothetical protein
MCTPTFDIHCTTRNTSNSYGGSETQFPGKFHDMMAYDVEREGLESTISWVENGRAFVIHDPKKLVDILPLFFSQTKYRSFRRQLNMWHFVRASDDPRCEKGAGVFMHPSFVRGNKSLCKLMSRQQGGIQLDHVSSKLQSNMRSDLLVESRGYTHCETPLVRRVSTSLSSSQKDLRMMEEGVVTMKKSPPEWEAPHTSTRTNNNHFTSERFCEFNDGDLVSFEGGQFHFLDVRKHVLSSS